MFTLYAKRSLSLYLNGARVSSILLKVLIKLEAFGVRDYELDIFIVIPTMITGRLCRKDFRRKGHMELDSATKATVPRSKFTQVASVKRCVQTELAQLSLICNRA